MKLIIISLILLCISIIPAGSLHAQPGHGLGLEAGGGVAEQLNLTPEQIEALQCDNHGEGRRLKQEIYQGKQTLNEMIRNKEISAEEISNQLEDINELQASFNRFKLGKILAARSVLDDEQLRKLAELKNQKQSGNQGRHSHSE